ncbi:glutamine amidotransferase-related protein [Leucobacter sp. gxy201]|uniref:type 1 glutamine amidotransferase n=1 Tax=Leucobacter sp. gxy201 TaxID=2957200 RepID=UPI003D9FF78E
MDGATGAVHSRPRVLVLQPDRDCGPARIERWARAAGADLDVRLADIAGAIPETLQGYDGLMVLGGDMGDGDTEAFPWLEDLRARLREARRDRIPALGICLGGQLLASALGGAVRRGAAGIETGVVEITVTEVAAGDPLMRGLPPTFLTGAMHGDAITRLPDDAVLLAAGARYPHQAFRSGSTWGVQFHPEIGLEEYANWRDAVSATMPDFLPEFDGTVAEFARLQDEVGPACERFVTNFLGVVAAPRGSRRADRE